MESNSPLGDATIAARSASMTTGGSGVRRRLDLPPTGSSTAS
jgi:hypothetical protein